MNGFLKNHTIYSIALFAIFLFVYLIAKSSIAQADPVQTIEGNLNELSIKDLHLSPLDNNDIDTIPFKFDAEKAFLSILDEPEIIMGINENDLALDLWKEP